MGKKILTVLLTIYLVILASVPISAAVLTGDGESVSVPVKYSVDTTEYIISIPAEITLANTDISFEIKADKMNLRPDEELVVTISSGCNSSGQVILQREGDKTSNPATLTTTLTAGGTNIAQNNHVVGLFKDSDNSTDNLTGNITMSALKIDSNTKSGDYSTVVEFKVQLRKV